MLSAYAPRIAPEEIHTLSTWVDAYDVVGDCWVSRAKRDPSGYCRARFGGARHYVHRLAYRLWVGEIPEGMTIDHTCRVIQCMNPKHLEVVTLSENVRRMRRHREGGLCTAGLHDWETHKVKTGSTWRCNSCSRQYQANYRARKMAAL